MDYFSKPDTYRIVERLNENKKEVKVQYNKVRNIIIMILLIIMGTVTYFVYNSNTGFLVYIPLGVGSGLIALSFLLTELTVRNKLIKSYLNDEVMNVYNMENEVNYIYTPKPKLNTDFNKKMGLFTRYSSVNNFYQITGSHEGIPFDIRALQLIVSTGNSSQVVFGGIYIILPIDGEKKFQIRTDGKPSLKKTKFKKVSTEGNRIYVLEDDNAAVKDKYIQTFDRLQREFAYKKMYIASNENEIHIALTKRKKETYPKELNGESFNAYYESFTETFKALNQITTRISEVF
jgi:hypothetical protein